LNRFKCLMQQFLVPGLCENGVRTLNSESDFGIELKLRPLFREEIWLVRGRVSVRTVRSRFGHFDVLHEQLEQAFASSIQHDGFDLLR